MAELAEADKERVVVLLGRFKRPAEIVEIMRDEHGVEVNLDQVVCYNPQHARFRADREKWEPIFNAARETYITDLKSVVVANQAWRLNELRDLYEKTKKTKNLELAAELLEQIAREAGGNFTNSRELNINDGRRAREMSSEDRTAALGALVSEAMAQKQEQPTKH